MRLCLYVTLKAIVQCSWCLQTSYYLISSYLLCLSLPSVVLPLSSSLSSLSFLPFTVSREVCQACYLVIESYLKGDSRKNENYLARFIEFFQTQVGTSTDTLVGRDCMSIQLIWFCFLFFKTHTHKHTCTNTHIYTRAFTPQVHMGLNAEEVMIEMVEDNA